LSVVVHAVLNITYDVQNLNQVVLLTQDFLIVVNIGQELDHLQAVLITK
jgi:hypothetical protein